MKNIPEFKVRHDKNYLPFLKAAEIDEHVSLFLKSYSEANPKYSITVPQKTPIEEIIELYCGITLDYQDFEDENILGMTTFSSGNILILRDDKVQNYFVEKETIIISNALAEDDSQQGRFFYTLAHELGHNVYHRKYYEEPDYSNQPMLFDFTPQKSIAVACHRDNIENLNGTWQRNWPEWQADYFGSCILMPKGAVINFWKDYISDEIEFELGATPKCYLQDMDWNKRKQLFDDFVNTFAVSRKAARIRLEKLNYLDRNCIL